MVTLKKVRSFRLLKKRSKSRSRTYDEEDELESHGAMTLREGGELSPRQGQESAPVLPIEDDPHGVEDPTIKSAIDEIINTHYQTLDMYAWNEAANRLIGDARKESKNIDFQKVMKDQSCRAQPGDTREEAALRTALSTALSTATFEDDIQKGVVDTRDDDAAFVSNFSSSRTNHYDKKVQKYERKESLKDTAKLPLRERTTKEPQKSVVFENEEDTSSFFSCGSCFG